MFYICKFSCASCVLCSQTAAGVFCFLPLPSAKCRGAFPAPCAPFLAPSLFYRQILRLVSLALFLQALDAFCAVQFVCRVFFCAVRQQDCRSPAPGGSPPLFLRGAPGRPAPIYTQGIFALFICQNRICIETMEKRVLQPSPASLILSGVNRC